MQNKSIYTQATACLVQPKP